MTDIAQGVGFDANLLPSYDDLAKKLGVNDKLEKASQALQTAQLTHQVLSHYKPYQNLTKSLSEAIFDPVKAKFEKTVSETASKIAGKFNPTGEGDGVASKFIKAVGDNPEDLLKFVKNPKALPKALLNKAIESSSLTEEQKALAKAVSEGQITPKAATKQVLQQAIEKSDVIPDELKGLAKSATEGKIPSTSDAKNLLGNIVDKADIPDEVKSLAKAAATGNRQTFMNAAKENIGSALDKSDLPEEVKTLTKSALAGEKISDSAKSALNTALDNSNLSPEIKSISKAVVSGSKKAVADEATRTLNNIVEKSNLSPEVQNLAKAAASGREPTLAEAKSAMDSVLPENIKAQLPEFEDLAQMPAQVTAKAKQFTELPKMAADQVERKIGKMNSDLVDNLRKAGINDEEIALNRDIDFSKIAKEAPLRLLDPSEITSDAPDLGLKDAVKSYRASKYLQKLAEPPTDSGMGPGGDSTLARLIKNDMPEEIKGIKGYTPKSKRDIKEQAKQRKLGKKPQQQEEAGPAEETPKTAQDVTEKQTINQNRELADEALKPFTEKLQNAKPVSEMEGAPKPPEIEPAQAEEAPKAKAPKAKITPTEEEGLTASDIAGGASDVLGTTTGAFGLAEAIKQKDKGQEVMQGTQLGASEGGQLFMAAGEEAAKQAAAKQALTTGAETGVGAAAGEEAAATGGEVASGAGKAASAATKLQTATDESLAGDEDPLGAGISVVLELATLATMLGGIFAPKPKQPVVVGGYQSGV